MQVRGKLEEAERELEEMRREKKGYWGVEGEDGERVRRDRRARKSRSPSQSRSPSASPMKKDLQASREAVNMLQKRLNEVERERERERQEREEQGTRWEQQVFAVYPRRLWHTSG